VQACTKGMFLWGEPLQIGDCTYIFIDSEGLGSTDQHATFDTQIFSLSILLASLFVLNTQGTINETSLEQLELVVQMTDRIRAKEEAKGKSAADTSEHASLSSLAQFFPSFLWVLRDFTLELQNSRGEHISANEYLEDALRPVAVGANAKKGAHEKNRIRSAISTVFPQRQCVTMVRPVAEERDLQKVSAIGASGLRQDFRAQIEQIKKLIPQLAQPKTVEGVQLNGRAFCAIAQNYVQSLNAGGIPTIRTAFQSVQEIQGREAMDQALDGVNHALKTHIEAKGEKHILADEALNTLLESIEQQARTLINDQALGNASDLHALWDHFRTKHLSPLFQSVRERNAHRAEKSFQSVVETLWEESGIEANLPAYKTYKSLNSDVSGFWTKYLSLTKNQGSKHTQVEIGRAFLDKKRELIFKVLFDQLDQAKAELAKQGAAAEQAQARVQELTSQLQQLQQDHSLTSKRLELELASERKDAARLHKSVEEAERRARAAEERAQTERTKLEKQATEEIRNASAKTAEVQGELKVVQSELRAAQAEVAAANREKSRLERSLQTAQSEAAAGTTAANQVASLQQELRASRADLDKVQSSLDRLSASSSEATASLSEKDRELRVKDEALKQKERQIKALEKEAEQARQAERQVGEQAVEIAQLKHDLAQAQAHAHAPAAAAAASSGYDNPMGLPAPTKGPLVSRKSVLPSSFSGSSSGAAAASARGKRKSPVIEQDFADAGHADYEMVDANQADEDEEDDAQSEAEASRRARSAAAAGSVISASQLKDPQSLSIPQLKSWLTSLNIEFPQKPQTKAWYIELAYDKLGDQLEAAFPRGGSKGKKPKKT
jgi:hypothetical protein